jgi:hypothetical protein
LTTPGSRPYQSLVKEAKKGFVIYADEDIIHFTMKAHVTPLGMIDLQHLYKNRRPIFDSSFRPVPLSNAVNDWTNKSNEPAFHFAQSWDLSLYWIWNLRTTYPEEEILIVMMMCREHFGTPNMTPTWSQCMLS